MTESLAEVLQYRREQVNLIQTVGRSNQKVEVSGDYFINIFQPDKCREIDNRASSERFVKAKRDLCVQHLKAKKPGYLSRDGEAIQAYNEILIYDYLTRRFDIEAPNERKKAGKSPDFIFKLKEQQAINLELKTILHSNPKQNYLHHHAQIARSIREAEMVKNELWPPGKPLSPIVTSPFAEYPDDIPVQRKVIVERFTKKANNQHDHQQLTAEGRDGILMIDTLTLEFPYFPQDGLKEYIYPAHSQYKYQKMIGGFLWYSCFGMVGEAVTDYTGNYQLEKPGVLSFESALKAVIFIIRLGGGPTGEPIFLGFHRSSLPEGNVKQCLRQLCYFVNDELNSNPNKLSIDPLDEYRKLSLLFPAPKTLL